ncbi:helix-turn-helix domain-containing protein [Fibrella forsythiae]|uniref:AraC family transcriptional regulator n=1 Tax=Fibrella forsythiae TaxID=2817061 RepID=A0ABS3JSK0_9BACT|nr:helix-turn-helix domain-containing protein [Fibrella forsythiae]MBO0952976.1 AraC family transcriptional regulator [Fibrella forsythiae]
MKSQSFIPSLPLRPYVEEYTFLQSAIDSPFTQSLPPGGRSGILFNLGSECQIGFSESVTVPAIALGGQITKTMHLTHQVGCQLLLITFRTNGIYHLFGVPMSEFVNQLVDVNLIFPPLLRQQWQTMLDQLRAIDSIQDRIVVVEKQLLAYVNRTPISHNNWVKEASIWLAQPGNGRIQKLSTEIRVSPRQLSREFSRQVGISPKSFVQVMRFRNIFRAINTQQTCSWLDLVHLGGWYDQSHFCNDIYEMTGLTPSAFFAQHAATAGLLINNYDIIN